MTKRDTLNVLIWRQGFYFIYRRAAWIIEKLIHECYKWITFLKSYKNLKYASMKHFLMLKDYYNVDFFNNFYCSKKIIWSNQFHASKAKTWIFLVMTNASRKWTNEKKCQVFQEIEKEIVKQIPKILKKEIKFKTYLSFLELNLTEIG